MATSIINRPSINIQKPKSGLDTFFEQLAKYSSPEYQLRKTESDARLRFAKQQEERDSARLLLAQNQFIENKDRQDTLDQRNIKLDNLNDEKFRLEEDQFEEQQFKNAYDIGKGEIDETLKSSYSDSYSAANMDVESVLANISDIKVRGRLKNYVSSWKEKGIKAEERAKGFMERFNKRKPDMQIDMHDARLFMSDKTAMSTYLKDSYIIKKPDISPDDKVRVTVAINRLASAETKMNRILNSTEYQNLKSLPNLNEQQIASLSKLEKEIGLYRDEATGYEADLARLTSGSSNDLIDAFGNQETPLDNQETPLPTWSKWAPVPFADDNYDIAFGTDSETDEVIVDNAVDTALKNAIEENAGDVIIEDGKVIDSLPAMELAEGVTQKEIEDMLVQAKEKGSEEEISFLEKQLSGLASAQAKNNKPKEVQTQLFPDNSMLDLGAEMAGDLTVEPIELDDFSNLPKAPAPTMESLNSLNIKDDKGDVLNTENPAKFQSQLKSMYNKIFRKGTRSKLSDDEYIRLNKELIRMIATGSGIKANNTDRMTKIIPREIEMFLKNKKHSPNSMMRKLRENIRWAGGARR